MMRREANRTIYFACTDEELLGWLRWSLKNGPGFLQKIAEGAFMADLRNYNLMRPVLLELKREWPRPA